MNNKKEANVALFSKEKPPQQTQGKPKSTQFYLDIAEIKDSIVVVKDGSLRLVLMVSSVNFDLKSEEEQNALIYQYQGFLNSLSFPVQILIQSRKVDLSAYLAKLEKRLKEEENELLKLQMADYLVFVKELIAQVNIMDKKFYIIIPYFPPLLKIPSSWEEIISGRPPKKLSSSEFETYKKEVIQRGVQVAGGLGSLGIRALQLNTQELIELFYNTYNPEMATREKLLPVSELEAEVIKKGE